MTAPITDERLMWIAGDIEHGGSTITESVEMARELLSLRVSKRMECQDVEDAFAAMGVRWPADPRSPREVFRQEVLPRIKALRAAPPMSEKEIALLEAAKAYCHAVERTGSAPDELSDMFNAYRALAAAQEGRPKLLLRDEIAYEIRRHGQIDHGALETADRILALLRARGVTEEQ